MIRSATAAELLGVTTRTLTEWRYKGKGPACYPIGEKGSNVLYNRADIEAWLISRRRAPVDEAA